MLPNMTIAFKIKLKKNPNKNHTERLRDESQIYTENINKPVTIQTAKTTLHLSLTLYHNCLKHSFPFKTSGNQITSTP